MVGARGCSLVDGLPGHCARRPQSVFKSAVSPPGDVASRSRQLDQFYQPIFSSGVRIESLDEFIELDRQLSSQDWWNVGVAERRLLTHPPGLPVLYRAVTGLATVSEPMSDVLVALGLFELKPPLTRADHPLPEEDGVLAGATLASLMHLLFIGFIPVGVYAVASLGAPSGEAYRAAILSCFVPSFHLYAAVPDALFPILGLAIVWTAVKSVRSNHVGYPAANAVLFALGSALKFSVVPFGLFSLLIFLLFSGDLEFNLRLRRVAIWVGFGCCLYLGLRFFAFDIIQRFVLAVANNQSFYDGAGRTYGESLLFNLFTFAGFCGLVIVAGYVKQLFEDLKGLKKTGWPAIGANPQLNLLFSGVIFLLLVSGSTRGEVERVWMLFMPFVALGAARWIARDDRRLVLHSLVSFVVAYTMCLMIETSFTF